MLLVTCALAAPVAATAAEPEPATGGSAAPAEDPRLIAPGQILVGKVATFRGTLPGRAGGTVTIERLDPLTGAWVPLASAPVGPDGAYVARWRADVTGRITTRATLGPVAGGTGAALALDAPPEVAVTVYRPANATWYGPGFYGRTTACGLRMTKRLLGVAHKRLPCGTMVAFAYKGRSITVPVVDRGPFTKGRSWDLTSAAAKALGFAFTDRLAAIPVD